MLLSLFLGIMVPHGKYIYFYSIFKDFIDDSVLRVGSS